MSANPLSAATGAYMGYPGADLSRYTLLSGPQLASEIGRIAVNTHSKGTLHTASFQPFKPPPNGIGNQDVALAEDWDVKGETWKFRAVFDGHANGNETVDFASKELPSLIRKRLNDISDSSNIQEQVKALLTSAITELDDIITKELLALFPSDKIEGLDDETIRRIANAKDNAVKVARCMRGTTVVVAIIGPNADVWTATVGDSQAVIGTKNFTGQWTARSISSNHNATEASEVRRVIGEHPPDERNEVIQDDRVLGVIAVTRAIGDHLFKLPSVYTSRVFMALEGGFNPSPEAMAKIDKVITRNRTPPYLSAIPDIVHMNLKDEGSTHACLILCSDGLLDLYGHLERGQSHLDMAELATPWIRRIAEASIVPETSDAAGQDIERNLALRLIFEGLGGADTDRVSRMITVQSKEKWMDDTTVVVEGIIV